MAKAIEDAIAAIERRPSEPQKDTADNDSFLLLAALAFISGGAFVGAAKLIKKENIF